MESVRVDKWLWSIRFFKTRTIATNFCKAGNVKNLQGNVLKPSSLMRIGDTIEVKRSGIVFTLEVLELLSKRVSAQLAQKCYRDLTSEEEIKKFDFLYLAKRGVEYREKGSGRPTKRERRELEDFKGIDFDKLDNFDESGAVIL
jgi:ribosome-associated heat shock protein Hsp15